MRHLLLICFSITLLTASFRAQTPRSWSTSIIGERRPSNAFHIVELVSVHQGDFLRGNLSISSKLPEELDSKAPAVVVEGHQRADGTFWPAVELSVRNQKDTEWRSLGSSTKDGTESKLVIYSGTLVDGLRVNLDPFRGYVGKLEVGRILLKPSNLEVTFRLDDLQPPIGE